MKNFKNIAVVVLALVTCVLVAVAFAADGAGVRSQGITVYSQATGTTAATNTSTFTFDYPMNNLGCDFIMSPASAGTASVAMQYNQGTSGTLFAAGNLVSTTAVTAIATVSVTGKVFKTIRATVTAPTTTAVISVYCNGVQ
jgi:hypothetical protein